jgi:hypothetical protein
MPGEKISAYVADNISNPIKNEDLLDVSNEDGLGGFDVSKKILVSEFIALVNAGIINLYNADGTLLSDRVVTSATFFTQFLGGDVEIKMSDEVNNYAFIVRDSANGKMSILGYDQVTDSGELTLVDTGGTFFEARNSELITSNDTIFKALNGGGQINLRDFATNGTVSITSDNGAFGTGYMIAAPTYFNMGLGNVLISGDATSAQISTNYNNNADLSRLTLRETAMFFQVLDFGAGTVGEMGIKNNVNGIINIANLPNLPSYASSQNLTINQNVINSFFGGGISGIKKTDNANYGNKFIINNGEAFETVINATPPTADRTQTLQDLDGTIALVENGFVGNSLFVSSAGDTIANGATRESLLTHFSDPLEAVSVAVAGDTIFVYGNQTPNGNLYKDGVTWEFMGNPTITNNQALFNDGGIAGKCVVRGRASFDCVGGVFNFSGVGTVLDIECENAITTTGVAAQLIDTVGTITISNTIQSSSGATIYIDLGTDVIINAKNIIGLKTNGLTLNVRSTFTGNLIINADLITATPTVAGSAVCQWAQVGSTGKTIINVTDKIQLLGSALTCQAVLPGNGTVIINGDIDGGSGNAWGIEQTPENVTHNGNAINDGTQPLVEISGSDACSIWLNGIYTSSNADVIVQNNVNSTLFINGRIENTNALAVSKTGIQITGNLATIIQDLVIILDGALGTPTMIDASVATKFYKNQRHLGSNFGQSLNVGNLIGGNAPVIDTDYQ